MNLLIEHGTWAIVPALLILGLVYLHAYGSVFPRMAGRELGEAARRARRNDAGGEGESADQPE